MKYSISELTNFDSVAGKFVGAAILGVELTAEVAISRGGCG